MSRFLSWFSTPRGRLFTKVVVGTTAISIFCGHVAVHGPMQHKVKEIYGMYKKKKLKPISPKLQLLINEVLRDSNLKQEEKKRLHFFNVAGADLFHVGGTNSPWGALIGLPFMLDDISDVNFDDLRLHGHEKIDWALEGNDLLDAFALSEKAKKFAILREIYSCDIWDGLNNALISSGCFLLPATFVRNLNRSKNTFETFRPRTRFVIYAAMYFVGYMMYRCLKDPLAHHSAKRADEMSAATNPEYLEGGVEFYQKLLLRNRTLRQMLGPSGEKMYNEEGSENFLLLFPKLPTKKRLELLQNLKIEAQTAAM